MNFVTWSYTVSWDEIDGNGRRYSYARTYEYDNEAEARASWGHSTLMRWVGPTQINPNVSDLYRTAFENNNGERGTARQPVAVTGGPPVPPPPGLLNAIRSVAKGVA